MELEANRASFQRRAPGKHKELNGGIITEPTVTNTLSARRGEFGFPFSLPYFAGTFKPLVYLHVEAWHWLELIAHF